LNSIWVFNGQGGQFPGGVFSRVESAEEWIGKHLLTGTLTKYPIDIGVYEWAIDCQLFEPQKPYQYDAGFIGRFSSAGLEHYHYEKGLRQNG
jgi:hypothetical protein